MAWLSFLAENGELLVRLLTAAALGAAVGLERDLHGRDAGLRTHALVSVGAAAFTILSLCMAGSLGGDGSTAHDPGRIAAQVVTGIGFLGAGTILKSNVSIRGLTTASCLWLVAAVGMSCGMGMYPLAIAATGLALLFLVGVGQLERYLPRDRSHRLTVVLRGRVAVDVVRRLVRESGLAVLGDSVSYDYETNVSRIRFALTIRSVPGEVSPDASLIVRLDEAGLPLLRVDWDQAGE